MISPISPPVVCVPTDNRMLAGTKTVHFAPYIKLSVGTQTTGGEVAVKKKPILLRKIGVIKILPSVKSQIQSV